MSNPLYCICVTDGNGDVVLKETVEGSKGETLIGASVVLFTAPAQAPKLPSRNPLHPEALTIDDLTPGLTIRRHNTRHNNYTNEALVNGKPFRHGDKYGESDTQAELWMIPVVTTNNAGRLVQEDWFLADMGVEPYVSRDNSRYWNSQNYTLATS